MGRVGHVICSGCDWPAGLLVPENYEYKVENKYERTGFQPLDEDQPNIVALLKWLKETYIDYTSDSRVIHQEELIYLIRGHNLQTQEWLCEFQVFNIRDQLDEVVTFQLKGKTEA